MLESTLWTGVGASLRLQAAMTTDYSRPLLPVNGVGHSRDREYIVCALQVPIVCRCLKEAWQVSSFVQTEI